MVIAGHQLKSWLSPAMNAWTDTIIFRCHCSTSMGIRVCKGLAFINHNPIALIPNPRDLREFLKEITRSSPLLFARSRRCSMES